MNKWFILFLNLILFFPLKAQEHNSIIFEHYMKYGIKNKQKSFYKSNGEGIIPLTKAKSGIKGVIYGYLPDWEYQSARYTLDYTLLTHISTFDFTVSDNGGITAPSYWPWTDIINSAHVNGVKVIMTAVNFTGASIHNILIDSTVKANFFINVKNIINTYKLDGVNVDFESVLTADRGALLNSFMKSFTDYIHTQLPGKEVSFAAPAVNWGGWNLTGLAESCDYLFIMGYDFYGSWSTNTGPVAPLIGGSYNVTNTVNSQYGYVTNNNPSKLILGVPYYGKKWQTETGEPGSKVKAYIGSTFFRDDFSQSEIYGKLWSSYQAPWYKYQQNNEWYQVWYDNDSSLGLKYHLAQSKKLRGVGMWALGFDGTRKELWNELRKRFSSNMDTISGKITFNGNPLSDVMVNLSGLINLSVTTGSDGKYAFSVPEGGTYTVMPVKKNYIFNPASQGYIDIKSNTAQDFSASLATYSIGGTITENGTRLSGVKVKLGGSKVDSFTTDANGIFIFYVEAAGNYTLTPSRENYVFTPNNIEFKNLSSNQIQEFKASKLTAISEKENKIPLLFKLENNYPNPFNPSTVISYHIPFFSLVVLKIYDIHGKEIKTLINEEKQAGHYSIRFIPEGLSSGIYYCRIYTGAFSDIKKMIYIR